MARTHARIYTSIWADDDFRRLTKHAQRLYVLLITQPTINHCGVLPYVPKKWMRLAPDETEREFLNALGQLLDGRFIVLDEQTDELLIRTFIRHDRIVEQQQIRQAARRQFSEIESRPIKTVLAELHPDLFEGLAEGLADPSPDPLFDPLAEGSPNGLADPLTEGSRVGTRATRAPSPTPAPTPGPSRSRSEAVPSRAQRTAQDPDIDFTTEP